MFIWVQSHRLTFGMRWHWVTTEIWLVGFFRLSDICQFSTNFVSHLVSWFFGFRFDVFRSTFCSSSQRISSMPSFYVPWSPVLPIRAYTVSGPDHDKNYDMSRFSFCKAFHNLPCKLSRYVFFAHLGLGPRFKDYCLHNHDKKSPCWDFEIVRPVFLHFWLKKSVQQFFVEQVKDWLSIQVSKRFRMNVKNGRGLSINRFHLLLTKTFDWT